MRWLCFILACLLSSVLLAAQQDLAQRIHTAQSAGDYSTAAQLYLQLIAGGTDSPEIRSNCGIMLHLAGKNREALQQFQIALQSNSTLTAANLFAGVAEIDLGRPKAAIPFLKRAQETASADPAPSLALGRAYLALREYSLANESYSHAAKINSSSAEAWYGVGVTDRSIAEHILNRAAHGGAVRKEEAKERLAQALEALRHAIELDPSSARVHLILAESLRDSDELPQAIEQYQTALQLDPKMDAAYLGLATAYWKNREFNDALPLLRKVLADSPRDPEANGIMADILAHEGKYEEAKRFAGIALAGNPDLIETRIVLARIHLATGQPRQAIGDLQNVLAADTDGSYHFLLYRAYKESGDPERAKAALRRFEQLRYGSERESTAPSAAAVRD